MEFIEDFEKGNMAWGKKEIAKRAEDLARLAYQKVWKIK